MEKKIEIKNLKYHVLPAKRVGGNSFAKLHDDVFNFFVQRWEAAFDETKDVAKPAPGWEDHFLKQDIVTAITENDKVVAAHLYTVYDLSAASTRKSEYFSFVTPKTLEGLLKNDVKTVFSMEYLCVDSGVQRNSLGVSFGKVIAALGGRLAEDRLMDGGLGTPLRSNKVADMMRNVGGYMVQENFEKYGYDVDLLLIPTKPCEKSRDPKVREIVTTLWETRADYTNEYYSKIAA